MNCLQREVTNTSKTVTSFAIASGNNHIIIKNTVDQTNERLERLRISDVTQHETTKEILDNEFKTLKQQYEEQKELNQKNADALNDCKTLLESIYVALPLCFQRKKVAAPSLDKEANNNQLQTCPNTKQAQTSKAIW